MTYKFNQMTTEALKTAETKFEEEIEEKVEEIRYLREQLAELRRQRKRVKTIIYNRSKSKYNGEFYVLSEFRLKYQKPYNELTKEEKAEYHRRYWHKYWKYRRKKKEQNGKKN